MNGNDLRSDLIYSAIEPKGRVHVATCTLIELTLFQRILISDRCPALVELQKFRIM